MGICACKAKVITPIPITHQSARASPKIKKVLIKFTKDELRILKDLYKDLSRKTSDEEAIDKNTFIQFFSLPGLLGERLFQKFDINKQGSISFEDFLIGFASFSKGTLDQKYKIIFDLYDLKEDGVIDKNELVTIIHNSYKETADLLPQPTSTTDISSDHDLFIQLGPSKSPIRKIEKRRTTSVFPDEEYPENKEKNIGTQFQERRVQLIAAHILDTFGNKSTLTFIDFKNFLTQHPKIFEVFRASYKEDIWLGVQPDQIVTKDRKERKRCKTIGGVVSAQTFADFRLDKFPSINACDFSGFVYQKSKETGYFEKKFAALKKSLLLIHDHREDKMPSGVIFMDGCYVDIIGDYYVSKKFGISISHESSSYNEINLWFDSREERDEWIKLLEIAAKTRKFKEYYELKEKIGHGRFSDVHIVIEHSTNQKYAVKIITKARLTHNEAEMLRSEIAIMRLLDHPGVIQLKEVFDTKKHMLIVMEQVRGGELYQRIVNKKYFSEYAVSQIIKQLLEVVRYLHDVGIIHRDIKPENILLVDNSEIPKIKLADFGLSQLAMPGSLQTLTCGTLGYAAPEVLAKKGYDNKVDLWSVGVITYLLLHHRLPIDHPEKQELIDMTLKAPIDFEGEHWKKFSPQALDFVQKLLNRDPKVRLSADEALQHEWIQSSEGVLLKENSKENSVAGESFQSGTLYHPGLTESSSTIDKNHRIRVQSLPELLAPGQASFDRFSTSKASGASSMHLQS
ncbi:unnamed protein product [Blepharisma stoltei]|uniref:non-specific serine/threonine protein kinase n=1 Tax=Blepharisma stoltei TaxID=1481888 RepID=A0AAU9KLI1_9CILI|nr:unnamed protein product [Blepharisma stoltei]